MLMKIMITVPIFVMFLWVFNNSSNNPEKGIRPITSIYDHKVKLLNNEEIDWDDYRGKKILIVNVASNCGYTNQYNDLQELYETHGDVVEIIAFPCNDFGSEEPGSSSEIENFCRVNYGVTFSITEKINIKGQDMHPVYKWLTDKSANGWNSSKPSWNFCKYLIDEKGNLQKYYRSGVNPMSDEIIADIIE